MGEAMKGISTGIEQTLAACACWSLSFPTLFPRTLLGPIPAAEAGGQRGRLPHLGWTQILGSVPLSCVTLVKLLDTSELQLFPL